jgi:hypothetical protein
MEQENSLFTIKSIAKLGLILFIVALVGAFIEPPQWIISAFAFIAAMWLCWLISTYILDAVNSDWDEGKSVTIGLLVSLFIVINLFAWVFG